MGNYLINKSCSTVYIFLWLRLLFPRSILNVRSESHSVALDMKGCICHFLKWQMHIFISNGVIYPLIVLSAFFIWPLIWKISPGKQITIDPFSARFYESSVECLFIYGEKHHSRMSILQQIDLCGNYLHKSSPKYASKPTVLKYKAYYRWIVAVFHAVAILSEDNHSHVYVRSFLSATSWAKQGVSHRFLKTNYFSFKLRCNSTCVFETTHMFYGIKIECRRLIEMHNWIMFSVLNVTIC